MKAVLCKRCGPPESLVVEEVPSAAVGAGQVRIAVHACGVNFPDTLIIQDKYQFKPPLPFTPGGEVAGIIVEIGAGVTRVKTGDRVIAMVGWGGFAEEIVVEAERTMPVPREMDLVTAAGFTMTYGTSYHALEQRARLRAGETLLVLGAAGGVGLAAVELGRLMGARVIAAAGSEAAVPVAAIPSGARRSAVTSGRPRTGSEFQLVIYATFSSGSARKTVPFYGYLSPSTFNIAIRGVTAALLAIQSFGSVLFGNFHARCSSKGGSLQHSQSPADA